MVSEGVLNAWESFLEGARTASNAASEHFPLHSWAQHSPFFFCHYMPGTRYVDFVIYTVHVGAVRITSWYPKFNGNHFGLPPSCIHKMTGLGVNDDVRAQSRLVTNIDFGSTVVAGG